MGFLRANGNSGMDVVYGTLGTGEYKNSTIQSPKYVTYYYFTYYFTGIMMLFYIGTGFTSHLVMI